VRWLSTARPGNLTSVKRRPYPLLMKPPAVARHSFHHTRSAIHPGMRRNAWRLVHRL
jgi:hypothetical protein